jgi:1-phosphatidylinositol phosphodiesterase
VELEDVLWGLYHFLDAHPTETLLVSLKVDHGTDSLPVQEAAHALITTSPVSDYWVQSTSVRQRSFKISIHCYI